MNLPNKLSIVRIVFVPIIIFLMYLENNVCRALALIFFVMACITDFLDGYLARKNEIITDLGKFIDPLADKILVISVLVMLVHLRELEAIVPIIVLFREFSVDGLRLAAASAKKRKVIAASPLGKAKTVLQMIAIIMYLIRPIGYIHNVIMYISVIMTIVSGIDYFIRNRKVIS